MLGRQVRARDVPLKSDLRKWYRYRRIPSEPALSLGLESSTIGWNAKLLSEQPRLYAIEEVELLRWCKCDRLVLDFRSASKARPFSKVDRRRLFLVREKREAWKRKAQRLLTGKTLLLLTEPSFIEPKQQCEQSENLSSMRRNEHEQSELSKSDLLCQTRSCSRICPSRSESGAKKILLPLL